MKDFKKCILLRYISCCIFYELNSASNDNWYIFNEYAIHQNNKLMSDEYLEFCLDNHLDIYDKTNVDKFWSDRKVSYEEIQERNSGCSEDYI